MKTTLSRMMLIAIMLLSSLALAAPTKAAQAMCTATVTTMGTDFGPTKITGNTIHYSNFQFRGSYDSGTLTSATFTGSQKATENTRTAQVRAHGSYVITTPTGTLTIRFHLKEDDTTGDLSGGFTSSNGTGTLAHARWSGKFVGVFIGADDKGLPSYRSTFSGPCRNVN